MPVWFGRWLQGADTLQTADGIAIKTAGDFNARRLAGQFTGYPGHHGKPAHTTHLIVDTTHCTHENARMG